MNEQEREVISKLIELYRDQPCLWDINSEIYRDTNQRNIAWEILVQKLKELEPDANAASVKKKIENLKTAYKREARKVKESVNRRGATISEALHKPKLWYFELMTFLDKKDDQHQNEIDPCTSEDELHEQIILNSKRKGQSEHVFERKKHKFVDIKHEGFESKPKKPSPFVMYVEDQLQNVSKNQRHIAEKLISDVLFLAKTENLHFDTKIETSSRLTFSIPSCSQFPSSQYFPSTQFIKSDHSYQFSHSPLPPSTNNDPSKSASMSPPLLQTNQPPSNSSQYNQDKIKLAVLPQNLKNEIQWPISTNTSSSPNLTDQIKTPQVPLTTPSQQQPRIIKLSIPPLSTCKVIQKTSGSIPKVTEGPAGTLLKGLLQQLQSK